MTVTTRLEIVYYDHPDDSRLKRHVRHDSRSKTFEYLPRDAKPKKINTFWDSGTGPLNQGQIGACTGNATVQVGNTHAFDLFRAAIAELNGHPLVNGYLTETHALDVYELATRIDTTRGSYPPDDTGSSGLYVAKAAVQLGLIGSYQHTFSFAALQAAVETTPLIVGTLWTKAMFTPVKGLVKVGSLTAPNIAGGHEYALVGIDWDKLQLIFRNSWGDTDAWTGCLPGGYFRIGFADFERLLAAQGDATVLIGKAA